MSGALLQILKQQAAANEKQDWKLSEEASRGLASSSRHQRPNKHKGFSDLENLHGGSGTPEFSDTREALDTTTFWLDDDGGGGEGGGVGGDASQRCSLTAVASGSTSPMLDSIMLELSVELPEVTLLQDQARSSSHWVSGSSGLWNSTLITASSRRSAEAASRRTLGSQRSSLEGGGVLRKSLQRDLGVLQGAKKMLTLEQESRSADAADLAGSDATAAPLQRISRVSSSHSSSAACCSDATAHRRGTEPWSASQEASLRGSPDASVHGGIKLHRLQRNSVVLDGNIARGEEHPKVLSEAGGSGSTLEQPEDVRACESESVMRESYESALPGWTSQPGVELQPCGGSSQEGHSLESSFQGQAWDSASACGGMSNAEAKLTQDLEAKQHSCWDTLDRFPVFMPTHPIKACWDWVIVLLVLYVAVMVPFQATFLAYTLPFATHPPTVPRMLGYWDIAVDCAFILDVVLNFNTGFTRKDGVFITSHRAISKSYVKSFFLVDFVSSVPIDWFLSGVAADVGALALVKCIRLLRLGRLMKKLDQMRSANIFRVVKLLLFFTIIAHWAACLWYLFGQLSGGLSWIMLIAETLDSQGRSAVAADVIYWYMLSLYWSLTTLTTVGYGDITPVSSREVWYTIAIELIGVVVSAVITGQVAVLLAAYEAAYGRYHHNIELFNMFISINALPESLSKRMLMCIDYFFYKYSGLDLLSVTRQVSPGLQAELQLTMYGDLLASISLLSDMPDGVMKRILENIRHEEYFTEDYVIRAGDPIRGMFIVQTGRMAVISPHQGTDEDGDNCPPRGHQEGDLLHRGHVIGISEMAFSTPFTSHVRCLEPTELLFVSIADLSEALELSPEFRMTFHGRLQTAAKRNSRAKVQFNPNAPPLSGIGSTPVI